ncbi:uncharacterized protein artnb [Chanos chanos]|uniref:Uncharacterized protein artnb n=1 Tax=Chanos chanos TaxID=29144 RepID=A0A6J2V9A9_CHACN|nr:uncharacterized protein LOC115811407 [Chanos chanos]
MLSCRRGTRVKSGFALSDLTSTLGIFGGKWRQKGRVRQGATAMTTVAGASCQPREWKVVLWVVVSLLPLVTGDRNVLRADPQADVDLDGVLVDKQHLIETLAKVEDELEERSDSHSPWHNLFEPSVVVEDEDQQRARWERSLHSSDRSQKGARKKKKKKKEKGQSSHDCRMEKKEIRVRDLGLGFDSDEIILFKYCVGTCQRARGNYDLAVRAMLANGSVPKRTARKISAHPCCRPTRYEPVSFMDTFTSWNTIEALSAADCQCVG